MISARVVDRVWSSKTVPGLPNGAFLELQTDDGARLVAFDGLGSGIGERVLVATGSVVLSYFHGSAPPIDALVIASVDESTEPTDPSAPRPAK